MSFKTFDSDDIVEGFVSRDLTSNLWSGTVSTLMAAYTSSTQTGSDSGNYQWFVYDGHPDTDTTAAVQYSVAWGHRLGSGSAKWTGATDGITPSKAVYSQFANLLLNPTDGVFTVDGADYNDMAFISVNRARFKEQMNPGGWELTLSASVDTLPPITLIDESSRVTADSVNGSSVYNIVSGSITDGVYGTVSTKYGVFYPEIGVLAMPTTLLSQSGIASTFETGSNASGDNINKIWTAVTGGNSFTGRSQEDVSSTHYFVRLRNSELNYSNNPTFITGSGGYLRYSFMDDDPEVYITTVGLYNDSNELLAVAKLSKPFLKNFERETTVRVKLDFVWALFAVASVTLQGLLHGMAGLF